MAGLPRGRATQKAEDILLESEERVVPRLRTARKVHAHLLFRSRIRRRAFELDIIDYYFLSVKVWRAGLLVSEYALDLRFVDSALIQSRRFASRWIAATGMLLISLGATVWWVGSSSVPWWRHDGMPACAALLGLAACAAVGSVYRTTESLILLSIHGRAKLLECTAGLGKLLAIRPFIARLEAHIQVAAAARRASQREHLRDEMREHYRLKEAGVLPEDEYEASKKLILASHTLHPHCPRPAKPLAIAP